ncbi:Adenylate kinase (Fragment) [Seminavis robusta]|uniref:Adenylate kinase n=1 Tax=Seminavis robusta TaxID=568900 RepID=A0A9N8HL44_9STRA
MTTTTMNLLRVLVLLGVGSSSVFGFVVPITTQPRLKVPSTNTNTMDCLCIQTPETFSSLTKIFMASDGEEASPIKIIIAGAPASGKGTQCETIKEKFGVVHLSTGDMLRAAVAAQTEVGKSAKEYMDSGKLVPDEVIIGVVKDRLAEEDCAKQGWLLDGFPRTQAQAKALEDAGVSADCFLFLNVPDEVLVERVVGRRTDPETGKIYHMTFSPPADEAVLARLEQRSDDTEEKVVVRLEQFHANVKAVKDSYTEISVMIDGNRKPGDVSNDIMEALDKAKANA